MKVVWSKHQQLSIWSRKFANNKNAWKHNFKRYRSLCTLTKLFLLSNQAISLSWSILISIWRKAHRVVLFFSLRNIIFSLLQTFLIDVEMNIRCYSRASIYRKLKYDPDDNMLRSNLFCNSMVSDFTYWFKGSCKLFLSITRAPFDIKMRDCIH